MEEEKLNLVSEYPKETRRDILRGEIAWLIWARDYHHTRDRNQAPVSLRIVLREMQEERERDLGRLEGLLYNTMISL